MRQPAGDAAPHANLLTTRDVQSLIKVDRSTIYRMAEDGRLPAIKVGRQWRFPEDRLHEWLHRHESKPAVSVADTVAPLRDLIAPESMQALTGLLGDLLGVMVLVTDMAGHPLAEVGNPCGLFAAAHRHPGVMQRCILGWREMADEPDMEPHWKPTPLGFLCARTLVRVGDQLKGMVLAGGIAPVAWPPGAAEVKRLAADLGVPADVVGEHIDDVYRLDSQEQERVLRLLPRLGAFLSRLAGDNGLRGGRAWTGPPPHSKPLQRSEW